MRLVVAEADRCAGRCARAALRGSALRVRLTAGLLVAGGEVFKVVVVTLCEHHLELENVRTVAPAKGSWIQTR